MSEKSSDRDEKKLSPEAMAHMIKSLGQETGSNFQEKVEDGRKIPIERLKELVPDLFLR